MPTQVFKIVWNKLQVGVLNHPKVDHQYMKGTWSSFQDQIANNFEAVAKNLDHQEVVQDWKKGIFIRLLPQNSKQAIFGLVHALDQTNTLFVQIVTDEETIQTLIKYFEAEDLPNDFYQEATDTTPEISFKVDTGELYIFGDAYPEYSLEYFEPLFNCLKKYTAEGGKKLDIHFKINDFNTSSSRRFLEFMNLLEDYQFNKNGDVVLNWYYKKEDLEMLEMAQEYAEDVRLRFNIIPY